MPDNETESAIVKFALYCLGVAAGLGARLATMHKHKTLTWKDSAANAAIAFAAAILVYFWLKYLDREDMALPMSVITGRYGDDFIKVSYRWMKQFLKVIINEKDDESTN